jgi:flavin-dependent thymidylate synthase
MEKKSSEVQKWADPAMFHAEPLKASEGPKVYLLWMTPDPLGAIAAACKMYKGEVVRSLDSITDAERLEYFEQVQKTKLKAPFEFVKFHFMIEGVTRSFTHQMVRQRTAVYAQESLRFAVKDDMAEGVALPPSLIGTKGYKPERDRTEADGMRAVWDDALDSVEAAYSALIDAGMPAEDARGLLPHNITTRLHYSTDLRALLDHAGNRLCTQAQFEWRAVFARIIEAIRDKGWRLNVPNMISACDANGTSKVWMADQLTEIFKPVCFQTGKCEFKADFDRKCKIRNRVDANENIGRSPVVWEQEFDAVESNPIVSGVGPESVVRDQGGHPVFIGAIKPVEWIADAGAAR